jgi:hypothetical protein
MKVAAEARSKTSDRDREADPTTQHAPQDNQLMPKHRVLSFKAQLRLE